MIEHVIFDLSEVLLPGLIGVEEALEARTGKPKDLVAKALGSYPYYEIDNNLDKLLQGELSYEAYRSVFLSEAGLSEAHAPTFDHECLNMFASPYPYTEEMLEKVAESSSLYLLSDHCEVWAQYITQRHSFFKYFSGLVWSYEIGATKKMEKPFSAITEKYQLTPSSCLFVDDNKKNISNAIDFGFKTVHFTGEESVNQVYRAIEND